MIRDSRGISPVVGTVILVGIAVTLAALSAYVLLGINDRSEPAPEVAFELQEGENLSEFVLVHKSGDRLDGGNLTLRGTANPDSQAGRTITASDELSFYPIAEEIRVVWHDEYDTSYTLTTVTVEQALPAPDEGCDWVENETNGGTDPAKVDGIVVNCDVTTDEQIEIQNGGVIVGDATSNLKELDGDDATVYGDVAVEKVLNMQDGTVTGAATSQTADVKLGNATVEGPVEAEKVAEAIDGSVIEGDMESHAKDTKILGGSVVEGSVTADGIVKLQDSEVRGDVFADPSDFDCTNSVINGQNCAEYTPQDPSDW